MPITGNLEHNNEAYVCYVDYEKAFDRVNKLMTILQAIGVDWRDRKLIWNLYNKQTAYDRLKMVCHAGAFDMFVGGLGGIFVASFTSCKLNSKKSEIILMGTSSRISNFSAVSGVTAVGTAVLLLLVRW